MQYCESCFRLFHEWEGVRADGRGLACPWCGETEDIVPAAKCRYCGEEFPPDEMEGGLCPGCRLEAQELYTGFWDSFHPAFQNYVLETDYTPGD